jgi:hypothetical protein
MRCCEVVGFNMASATSFFKVDKAGYQNTHNLLQTLLLDGHSTYLMWSMDSLVKIFNIYSHGLNSKGKQNLLKDLPLKAAFYF